MWKSFKNIKEASEIIKYRHIHELCYISLYHAITSISVSVCQETSPIKTRFPKSINKMYLLEHMCPNFAFNLSVISIKKIGELAHNFRVKHEYFKVNHVTMTKSINRKIQWKSTSDKIHVSDCLVNIQGKVTTSKQKIKLKTEVGNERLGFTGMMYFFNKVYVSVYFFLYEYDILYNYYEIVDIVNVEFINHNLYIMYIWVRTT